MPQAIVYSSGNNYESDIFVQGKGNNLCSVEALQINATVWYSDTVYKVSRPWKEDRQAAQ